MKWSQRCIAALLSSAVVLSCASILQAGAGALAAENKVTSFSDSKPQYRQFIFMCLVIVGMLIVITCFVIRERRIRREARLMEEKCNSEEKSIRELFMQANFDELTGIYNAKYFMIKSQELIDANPERRYAVIYISIENFRLLQRMYGQNACNSLLIFISNDFKEKIGKRGIFCRFTVDSFVVCIPAERVNTERLNKLSSSVYTDGDKVMNLEYHMGICIDDGRGLTVAQMLENAQLAYQNIRKELRSNIAVYDDELTEKLLMEKNYIDELDEALQNEDFQIYLQPQFSHKTKKLIGAEALVRWIHPEKGMIPPYKFIPVFENSGSIFKLDEYVWDKACQIIKRWKTELNIEFPISVNISRNDMYADGWENKFSELIKKYEIPPELLHLEITESAYMEDSKMLVDKVRHLKNQGFVVAMDDFGSGYSSLNMLQDIDVDILKIDMRFLHSNTNSASSGNILKAVANMAAWLGMAVVTEGVETQEQADFMVSIGCEVIQGYFYGKPIPTDEFETLLKVSDVEADAKNFRSSTQSVSFLSDKTDLSGLLERIPVGVKIFDPDRRKNFFLANNVYCNIFGYTEEQYKAEHPMLLDLVCQEDYDLLSSELSKLQKADDSVTVNMHCMKKNGEKIRIHCCVKVMPEYIFGTLMRLIVVQDITDTAEEI